MYHWSIDETREKGACSRSDSPEDSPVSRSKVSLGVVSESRMFRFLLLLDLSRERFRRGLADDDDDDEDAGCEFRIGDCLRVSTDEDGDGDREVRML